MAKQLLENDHRVVVTARQVEKVADLAAINNENSLALSLDVTNEAQVKDSISKAIEHFGQIDVLVNNAGFGYFGSVEESEESEVRSMFETNFWGLSAMTRAVLPQMRKQKSGTIVQISSIGGSVAFPALSYYHATKYAVNGFSESLAKEVAPLGIKVMIVQPSGFRTDWAGRSANDAPSTISDYAATSDVNKNNIRGYSGHQPGDPVRAARSIIEAVESGTPPLHLLLGKAALKNGRIKLDELKADYDANAVTSEGADFPDEELAKEK